MKASRRDFLKLAGGALAAAAVARPALLLARPEVFPSASDPALHFLNRISYGARPDELERARQIGIEAYLDEQLNPASIDDSAADALLRREVPIIFMNRRDAYRLEGSIYRTYMALTEAMVLRGVHSRRQLFERMVEFWTDHFNIPGDQLGPDLIPMHNEVIRKHALGSFRDLLIGTAQSPAMLTYLDNYLNVAEHPNENYAREIMELHSLGVDGGYTEADVKEVARAFTGWTIHDGTETGFYFDASVHDTGEKVVLGHTLPADRGIEDGLQVLSILVNHPSTARYLCYKLCRRFVSDEPPQSLVDSAAAVWMAHRGQIVPVLRHIFLSAEFYQSAGQKLRRPLDFFIGALRATGTSFRNFWAMEIPLQDLAQVPYGWHPPDGYPDVSGAWINSSGLLARWNVAMLLTHSAYSEPDTGLDTLLHTRIGEPRTVGELVDAVSMQVFGVTLPEGERAPFIDFASEGAGAQAEVTPYLRAQKLGTLYGLMLASPLYQWR